MDRQIRNLKEYNKDIVIIQEIYTGTKTEERKAYQNLKRRLKVGDTLVFDSVSRMSRDAVEGIKEYFELCNKGIELVFLKESYINTEVYNKAKEKQIEKTGNRITDILLSAIEEVLRVIAEEQIEKAFQQSEKEVMDLRVRTKEALRPKIKEVVGRSILGRKQGTKIETKKAKEMKDNIKKLSKDFNGNLKDIEVLGILKIARNSYYKYKREIKV